MGLFAAATGLLGVLHAVAAALARNPFVLLFVLVAAGYALGRVTIKGVGLGATASTLLFALLFSLFSAQVLGVNYAIPDFAGTIFFNMFMFSIGMKVGPQFISGMRRDAGKFVLLAFLVPLLSVAAMFAVRALFDLAPGMTAGIFAGSNTATPGLGAAQTAINSGAAHLPEGVTKADAIANLSTTFAFAYTVSLLLLVVAMKLPDLLGQNTARAAIELEAELRGGSDAPLPGAADEFLGRGPAPAAVRAYAVERPEAIGQRLDELRRTYPWIAIERILREGRFLEPLDHLVIQAHDTVALYGPVPRLLSAGAHLGPEVPEALPRELGLQTVDIVARRDAPPGMTLQELARDLAHGLYLNAVFRGGHAIPFGSDTLVRRGDVLRVTGTEWRLKQLEGRVGKIVRPSISTDIVTLAICLALGGLIGMITIPLGAVRITIGAAVGVLLVGIALSTLRTYNPSFGGPYPEPARQMIEDIGLNVFVAILGINSGAGVVKAIQAGAIAPILVSCLVVGTVPALIAWVVGQRWLRMNKALLLGAVAGARCSSPGLRTAQENTRSTIPAISYPVTFAISNVILTVLTYVFAMIG